MVILMEKYRNGRRLAGGRRRKPITERRVHARQALSHIPTCGWFGVECHSLGHTMPRVPTNYGIRWRTDGSQGLHWCIFGIPPDGRFYGEIRDSELRVATWVEGTVPDWPRTKDLGGVGRGKARRAGAVLCAPFTMDQVPIQNRISLSPG